MAFSDKITERQLALLCDLAALQDAGFLGRPETGAEVSEWSGGVDLPGTVTAKGQKLVQEFYASGHTITF